MVANIYTLGYRYEQDGDIPWHKLGTRVKPGTGREQWLLESGLAGWDVGLTIPHIYTPGGLIADPKYRAIRRKTDHHIFGYATEGYTSISNEDAVEALASIDPDHELPWEALGALGQGERVWALAKLDEYKVAGVDHVKRFLLGTWGHDGSLGFSIQDTNVRVICQNTLDAAVGGGRTFRRNIRHTASAPERIRELRTNLNILHKEAAAQKEAFERLAQASFSEELLWRVVDSISPRAPKDAPQAEQVAGDEIRTQFTTNLARSATLEGVRDTRWGLYNAATEWIDHLEIRRGQNANSANKDWLARRALYTLDGIGAQRRQKVFDILTV